MGNGGYGRSMNFEVNRQNIRDTRIINAPSGDQDEELADGQIRLQVERFAVTSNNISYAVAGDMLDYWGFFPAEAPWGRVPAMGLGSVVASANPDIPVGGRYFGFYPMAASHVLTAQARREGFRDVGPHRANHAAVYTDFIDVAGDQMFHEELVNEYLLLRGLFTTSWLIDDFLEDNSFFGASQTLVTSASSKTSISLAHCLARRDHHSIGLTSAGNRDFVIELGLYDQVITYDEIGDLDAATPSVVVDMAGNAAVRQTVHQHFTDQLQYSSTVGATHWEAGSVAAATDLPGPTPEFFFAPSQIQKRSNEWGAEQLMTKIAGSLHEMMIDAGRWMTVTTRSGGDGITEVYSTLLEGDADPSHGFIVSP
jgi:hypothetical protein